MTEPTSRGQPASAPARASEKRSHGLLAAIQRLTGLGVWAHDVTSGDTWWSDQAKRIHGIDPRERPTIEDVAGRYADPDREAVLDRFDRAVAEGVPFDVVAGLVGDGTTERAIRVRCEPRSEDSAVVGLYGTVRDVTEAKRHEQRIEVLRRTSQRLKRAHSRQAVAEVVADAAKNILGLVNTTVRLVDEREATLRTVVATEECVERAGERPDYPVDADNPAARVYRTGDPEVHTNLDATPDGWDRGELRSGLYVPVGDHGVLSAGDVVTEAFDDRDLEAAGLLGHVGGEALARISRAERSRAV